MARTKVIKSLKKLLTVEQLREYLGNVSVVRKFADDYDLIQFGSVGKDDETRVVKGITASVTQRDSHYLVGTTYGRDVIFIQRTDTLLSANKKSKENYHWNILVLDLHNVALPHVYLEGRGRHRPNFYEALSIKQRELIELPYGLLSGYDRLFGDRFSTRLSPSTANMFASLVPPERAAVMAHHFHMFDFEWQEDMLYVYFLSAHPTSAQLEQMLNAGVWLARELDTPTACEVDENETASHS